jgi:hypothetical protein
LKHAATHLPGKLDVVFLYSSFLPSSITELLFFSPAKVIEKASNKEFTEGCSIIMNRYPDKIHNIRYEVLHSNTVSGFKAIAKANNVDTTLLAVGYRLSQHGSSFDPTRLINKGDTNIRLIDLQLTNRVESTDLIASLLTS